MQTMGVSGWYDSCSFISSKQQITLRGDEMKVSILLSALIALVSFGAFATQTQESIEVQIGINDVFVPGGFDAESDVYVVASGVFPNSCYSFKEAVVSQDKDTNIFSVNTMATVDQGMCLMVLVPFQKEVSLGVLGSGNHTIHFMSGDGTYLEKKIEIE